jgi:hypothetical protein
LQPHQLLRERSHPIDVIPAPTKVHPRVAAIDPTQVRKRLREPGDQSLHHGIVSVAHHEHADAPHAVALLRARRERPRRRANVEVLGAIGAIREDPDHRQRLLLRVRREWPSCRAAEERDELAAFHGHPLRSRTTPYHIIA